MNKIAVTLIIALVLISSIPITVGDFGFFASEVYVDDDYDAGTPGWGVTHFDNIQDGVDAVDIGGTVIVYEGAYSENVVIGESLVLSGENRNLVSIDGGGNDVITLNADNVNISGFTIENGEDGIHLAGDWNIIYNNILTDNEYAFNFQNCNNNTIYDNNITDNLVGIDLETECHDNFIYHNNFINNSWGNSWIDEWHQKWNDSYPSGGNYWDDHWHPFDNYSGPNQDIPGSDGIIDLPYYTGREDIDYYPFLNPLEVGKNPPIYSNPSPANAEDDVDVDTAYISIYIEDPDGDLFDWTLEGTYVQNTGANDDTAGTKTANLLPLEYYEDIIWYVNATDDKGNGVSATYYFTTEIYEIREINYVDDDYLDTDPQWHKSRWGNIQDAIDTVEDGGTIYIAAGTYSEPGNYFVHHSCHFIGAGKYDTIIEGEPKHLGVVDSTFVVSEVDYPDASLGEVDGVSFRDMTIKNAWEPFYQSNCIYLKDAMNVEIVNCHLEQGFAGIITTPGPHGIAPGSSFITIRDCTFENFEQFAISTLAWDVEISDCTIDGGGTQSIGIDVNIWANRTVIQSNIIEDCIIRGISVFGAYDTTIYGNVIADNILGVTNYNSDYSLIYHNNFLDNAIQADDNGGGIGTRWNKTYPEGGNYWDDFDSQAEGAYDRYHGINQNLKGRDGIVDGGSLNPYDVGGGEFDYYPLYYAWETAHCTGADFFWVPLYPEPNQEVIFYENACSTDIVKRIWEFGDGDYISKAGGGSTVKHTYEKAGYYKVRLTIEDKWGERDSKEKIIYIGTQPKIPPIQPPKYILGFTIPEMYQLLRADTLDASSNQVKIMVIDSGVATRTYEGINLNKITKQFDQLYPDGSDASGHGTWCNYAIQYILQQKTPNSLQISYKVFGADGGTTTEAVLNSFDEAIEQGVDIVSFSGGASGGTTEDPFSKKCEELRRAGIIVIVAAGNDGPAPSTINSPGVSDSVICIAASDPILKHSVRLEGILDLSDDEIARWSSRGPVSGVSPKPDVTAPGESIIGPWGQSSEIRASGTSMATPLIAGGVAVVYAQHKGLIDLVKAVYFWDKSAIPNAMEDALKESCYKKDGENDWGEGIVQFDRVSGAFQAKLGTLLIVGIIFPWILIILIIIAIIIYYVRRKYKRYKSPFKIRTKWLGKL